MAIQKPSIPKGTRDFSPEEVSKRQYIFDTVRHQFQLFGYSPIETPSFENLSTLTGKYGEEGDRLIFKILNSGDFFKVKRDTIFEFQELLETHEYLIDSFYSDAGFEAKTSEEIKEEILNTNLITNEKNKIILAEHFSRIKDVVENYLNDDFENNKPELLRSSSSLLLKYLIDFIILDSNISISQISEKALRYDLTVPFARYVVQHQNEIMFPFKRYQMQPVWRADRPQKGRFREFYQCDADVVGSNSLLQEVELVSLYDAVFNELKVPIEIHFNNRKILSGLAEIAGIPDKLIDFTVALDKLDKIGEEKVKEEMLQKGIPQASIDKLSALFAISGDFKSQLNSLETILNASEAGMKGIEETRYVFEQIENLGLNSSGLVLNLTLARGLDYYTGAILEVKAKNVQLGSIGGGGRYDDLTGIFGLKGLSGVGISFGLDRIYLVLEELKLFPESLENTLDVLFINFGEKESAKAMEFAKALRKENIRCEVYPDPAKMKKQMQYADKKAAKYVVVIGEEELKSGQATVKNMESGEQFTTPEKQLVLDLKGLV